MGAVIAMNTVTPVLAQTNVGVSVSVHQPGVYGRIDIGNYPSAQVVYPQPVVIVPTPIAVYRQPIYLYVPSNHQRHWSRYCGNYKACGQPVFFVREQWTNQHRRENQHYNSDHRLGRGDGKRNKHQERHDD
jgi:hypothetical protein